MSKKTICVICGEKPATVVDREEGPWAKKKKLCADCHVNRLKNDLITVLEVEKKRSTCGT